MLGKLLKHEFSNTARFLLPTYAAVFVLAIVGRLLIYVSSQDSFVESGASSFYTILKYASTFIAGISYILLFLSFAITFMYLVMRFYRNFFKEEGYLTFTLPVGTKSLLSSKLIASFIWTILNTVIFGLTFVIITYTKDLSKSWHTMIDTLKQQKDVIEAQLGISYGAFITEIVIWLITLILLFYLMNYVSLAIGQSFTKNHRIAGSLLSGVILFIATFIVTVVLLKLLANVAPDYMHHLADSFGSAVQATAIEFIVYNLLLSIIFFFTTDYMLKKKLDLE